MSYGNLLENYFSNAFIFLLKTAYPVYSTFKLINSNAEINDTKWLIYWVIFAFFSFIESYILRFVSYIPFFMICQVLFYIWLQLPLFNGSTILFNKFIKPIFTDDQNPQSFVDTLKIVYKDLLSSVPQPIYDEDSSPSADPNLNESFK